MTPSLPDPGPLLRRPDTKRRYTRALFDLIAPGYDRFTRWFSFGMDARWKRWLARAVARHVPQEGVVLDLACGTGDLTEAVRRSGGMTATFVGLDASSSMLRRAGTRSPRTVFVRADMSAVPLRAASVHAVMVGYGMRNAPDVDRTLEEMRRVLHPGGRLYTLEFFLPERRWWRACFLGYLRRAGRFVGWWWHGEPHAYGYIEASLRQWMTATAFADLLAARGFTVERVARRLGGGIVMHVARTKRSL